MENQYSTKNIVAFLCFFLLANFLCFIPSYLFYFKEGQLLELPNNNFLEGLFIRPSIDFIRIVPELVLIIFGIALTTSQKIHKWLIRLFYLFSFLFLLYNIYYFFYFFVYSIHPNFIQDFYLTKEVLPVFISSIGMASILNYLIVFLVLVIGGALYHYIIKKSLTTFKLLNSFQQKLIAGCFLIFVIISSFIRPNQGLDRLKTSQWTIPRIKQSFAFSKDGLQNKLLGKENYTAHLKNNLVKKPDVYFIFVESYGTVASLTKETGARYDSLIFSLEKDFESENWNVVSNYSRAPIIGGKSWLSFSTVMAGLKMYEHTGYNNIMQNQKQYPHIVEYFNQQGYETYRMNTFKANAQTEMKIPYEVLDEFWKFDHWVKFKDIPYQGYEYDIFGGIPDQYALGFLQDSIIIDSLPSFNFFITMNSHGPWFEPPPILEKWQDLDKIKFTPHGVYHKQEGSNHERYYKTIVYQLEMLKDFIINKVDSNSIVVLIGDHNPAGMEYKLWKIYNKFATQIHIFSKDNNFTNSFLEYKFDEGMHIDTSKNLLMNHEGFYSLFQRNLIKNYGKKGAPLPEYLVKGLEDLDQKERETKKAEAARIEKQKKLDAESKK